MVNYGGQKIGLSIKLKQFQRVYFDNTTVEISIDHGQIKMHFFGEKPFPFNIKRESNKDYQQRMKSEAENVHKRKVYNLHKIK